MSGLGMTHNVPAGGSGWTHSLNTSTLFAALLVLIVNIGGRYIAADISKAQEKALSHPVTRRVLLFAIFFLATRNVLTAFVLTVVVSFILFHLLHEESAFYIFGRKRPLFNDILGVGTIHQQSQHIATEQIVEKGLTFEPINESDIATIGGK